MTKKYYANNEEVKTLCTYKNTKEDVLQQHYGNKPIPPKHPNGVAAYDTIPEATALAKELTEMLGYKHIVTLDNKYGVAIVEITKQFYLPTSEGDVTMSLLQEFANAFKNSVPVAYDEKVNIALTEDGNLKVGEDYALFVKEINLGSLDSIEQKVFEIIKYADNHEALKSSGETGFTANNFNAVVMCNYAIQKAILIVYSSNIVDIDGNEVFNGDLLYDSDNSYYQVGQIALKKIVKDFDKKTKCVSYFWEVADNKNHYINSRAAKKTMWSTKDREKHDMLTKQEEDEKEVKESLIKGTVCVTALIIAIIGGIFGIKALMPHEIETVTASVTVEQVWRGYNDVGDPCEYAVLKGENGVSMTFRTKGSYSAFNRKELYDSYGNYQEDVAKAGTIKNGDELEVTLTKYSNGETKVSYNGVKLIRVE